MQLKDFGVVNNMFEQNIKKGTKTN